MLDLLIRGATIIDGTGAPRFTGDIGVRDGRVVAIGRVDEPARRTISADGLCASPGFVDLHTHYDAQVLWDPYATPSPLHGVTTVLGGNCGFTIAPLGDDADTDYIMRMMARVEGMPLPSLQAGPGWTWRSFGEWLDRIDGTLGVNAGFLAGHSTIRRVAMGPDAVGSRATPDQLATMVELLHRALADGALGFSTSLGEAHTDGDGAPVPSRASSHDELLALARATGEHDGTALEMIAAMGEIPADRIELMTAMSLAANRPLNWNVLGNLSPTEVYEQQLTSCDHARARGARVVALALPDLLRMRASKVLEDMPSWREIVNLSPAERRRAIADPAVRERLRDGAAEAERRGMGAMTRYELLEIAEAPDAALVGRTIAALAAERRVDPVDILIDVVLPDRLALNMVFPSLTPTLGTSAEGWRIRAELWNDDRVVLGGSDAGAHTDLMCHANYTTCVLGEMVRERKIFTLEDAIRRMTDIPARLYGLRDRGRIALGAHADLVLFDADAVQSGPTRARRDLPAGGERLYNEAVGIDRVLVNGHDIVVAGEFTGATPGRLLRSGIDTDSVTVPGSAASAR